MGIYELEVKLQGDLRHPERKSHALDGALWYRHWARFIWWREGKALIENRGCVWVNANDPSVIVVPQNTVPNITQDLPGVPTGTRQFSEDRDAHCLDQVDPDHAPRDRGRRFVYVTSVENYVSVKVGDASEPKRRYLGEIQGQGALFDSAKAA